VNLPGHAAIRKAAEQASLGASAALDAFESGRVTQEPELVRHTLTEIEHAVNDLYVHGTHWHAGTFSSLGRGSRERRFGADFVGLFEVQLPDYNVKKGFLAQAKLLSGNLGKRERERLRGQCEKMLAHTPDAFVWLFGKDEIRIVPAITVIAGDNEPVELYSRGIERFFEEHFACFIGDGAITTADTRGLAQLPALAARYDMRHALYIGVDQPRAA
jgi:hypothetical protein